MKAAVKATGGDDWEMLAPTNDGRVIRSVGVLTPIPLRLGLGQPGPEGLAH